MTQDWNLFGGPLPRRCSTCRDVKPVSAFKVDRSRPDGHSYVCLACERVTPIDEPNARDRREARLRGEAWCRRCRTFLPSAEVRTGLCRDHTRAEARERYANDFEHREARRAHSTRRKRGVERVPEFARELMMELFEGGCAYCPSPAETWDHVVPVAKGGKTEPSNIVPACTVCNSSKRDRDLDEWLSATGRELSVRAVEHLSHHGAIDG